MDPQGTRRTAPASQRRGPVDDQTARRPRAPRNSSRAAPSRRGYLASAAARSLDAVRSEHLDSGSGASVRPPGRGRRPLTPSTDRRVALVHDFLLDVRGAERVFLELCEMWPEADIYTAIYDEEGTEGRFAGAPGPQLVPAAPAPVREDVPRAAAVLSRGDRVVRPARLRPGRLELVGVGPRGPVRRALGPRQLLPQPLPVRVERPRPDARRGGTTRSSQRHSCAGSSAAGASGTGSPRSGPTATSRTRAPRRRGSAPTSAASRRSCTRRSTSPGSRRGPSASHYAIVSELMPHKQIDVAIEAFNQLRLPLIVIGDGPDCTAPAAARRARRSSSPGGSPDRDVAEVLSGARALIMTAIEEFGIAVGREPGRGPAGDRAGAAAARWRRSSTASRAASGRAGRPSSRARCCAFDDAADRPAGLHGQRGAVRPPRRSARRMLAEVEAACASGTRPALERAPAAAVDAAGEARRQGREPLIGRGS